MDKHFILIVAILGSLLVNGVMPFKCYTCYADESNLNECWNINPDSEKDEEKSMDCLEKANTMCVKAVTKKADGKPFNIVRGCAYEGDTGCTEKKDALTDTSTTTCFCDSENCNGANSYSFNWKLLMLVIMYGCYATSG